MTGGVYLFFGCGVEDGVNVNVHAEGGDFNKPREGAQQGGPGVGAADGKKRTLVDGEGVANALEDGRDVVLVLELGVERVVVVEETVDKLEDLTEVFDARRRQHLVCDAVVVAIFGEKLDQSADLQLHVLTIAKRSWVLHCCDQSVCH